jgi:SAM-dependent methyltransferase
MANEGVSTSARLSRRCSISVAIAAYNERHTIAEIIRQIKAVPREKEILVVDDGSTDGTRSILAGYANDPEVRVFFQDRNQGKGAALRRAFELATKDVVIVQDADLEYDPAEYEKLLHPIEAGRADVVYGSRFQHGERRVLYFRHTLGNQFLTLLSNLFTDLNLTDMETCYKAFKRQIIQNIKLKSRRFGFEPEITAKLAKLPCVIYEVPISYHGRSYERGKKITWRDGATALWHIVRFSMSRNFVKDQTELTSALVEPPSPRDHGLLTLEAFEQATAYNHWLFSRFSTHIGERVLEIGAGIGNVTAEILLNKDVKEVVATDRNADSLKLLHERLGSDPRLACATWDLGMAPPLELAERRFDTILCSNVLEHVDGHRQALASMAHLLAPGGRLLLLAPAHPFLYCKLDEKLGHFRRYRRRELADLLKTAGFEVEKIKYHNFAGMVGWLWTGKLLRRELLPSRSVRRFDRLVPIIRRIDPLFAAILTGVSLITVARRP